MRTATAPSVAPHNRFQRSYFERGIKDNMRPADTPYLHRHVEEMLAFGGIGAGAEVLEIGCGMGRYTGLLVRRGLRLEGLDLSPVLLDHLRTFLGDEAPANLHCCDVAVPPEELTGRFDAVLGFFMLHHLPALDGCFAAVTRLLRPGGRALFIEPNPWNPLYYVQIALTPGMHWRAERGLLRMRTPVVFSAFERAGLVRPALRRFGFLPPFAVNRAAGARAERFLERLPGAQPFLPFQIYRADRP